MRKDFIGKIRLEVNAGAAVRPAADVDGCGKAGRMARSLFDVDAHHGLHAAHAVGADVDLVQPFGDEAFEFSALRVAVVAADRAQESLFRKNGRDFGGTGNTDAYEKRRAGSQMRSKMKRTTAS